MAEVYARWRYVRRRVSDYGAHKQGEEREGLEVMFFGVVAEGAVGDLEQVGGASANAV